MTRAKLPMVTAVVCAYNGEGLLHAGKKVLRSCLESLARQSYPPDRYEVLVIDDESTDGTYGLVEEFVRGHKEPPAVRLVGIRHGGLSVARNSAIRLSRGEILAFVDQDAIPEPNWIEELVLPFLAGADFVGGRIDLLNDQGWQARFLQRTRYRQFFGPKILSGQFVGCNMALRKSVFDAVGGFHENFFSYGDESTLHQRLHGRFRYSAAPDAAVRHQQPDSIRGAIKVNWRSAKLGQLSGRASGKRLHWKEALLIIEQSLITLFPIATVGVLLGGALPWVLFVLSALALVRRLYIRPLNRALATGLMRDYGMLRGGAGHFLFCFLQNAIEIGGRCAASFSRGREVVIPPMTRELLVLRSAQAPPEVAPQ